MTLHHHIPHPHQHRNANEVHQAVLAKDTPIDKLITWVCDQTASAYGIILFIGIGTGAFVGYVTQNQLLGTACGAFSSSFLQLVYLALLLRVGKKSDQARQIQSDQMFTFGENTFHDSEQMMHHLDAQDAKILKIEQQNADQITLIKQLMQTLIDRDDALAAGLGKILTRLDSPTPVVSSPSSFFSRFTKPKQKAGKI